MGQAKPKAVLISFFREGNVTRTVVRMDKLPSEPIAPASLCAGPDGSDIILELHRLLEAAERELTFETYGFGGTALEPGTTYLFRSWWTLDQLVLVKDGTRIWQKENFKSGDAIELYVERRRSRRRKLEGEEPPPGACIVPDGWDHEHCSLCWETISCLGDAVKAGYTDGEHWLCERCHEKYIVSGLRERLG